MDFYRTELRRAGGLKIFGIWEKFWGWMKAVDWKGNGGCGFV